MTYLLGFILLPRQLAHEREMPPPYSPPPDDSPSRRSGSRAGFRRLLGLDQSIDDGTHDFFSEETAGRASPSSSPSEEIEMREVPTERWTPVSLARSNTP